MISGKFVTALFIFLAIVGPVPVTYFLRWFFRVLAAREDMGDKPIYFLYPQGWVVFIFVALVLYGLIFYSIFQLVELFDL